MPPGGGDSPVQAWEARTAKRKKGKRRKKAKRPQQQQPVAQADLRSETVTLASSSPAGISSPGALGSEGMSQEAKRLLDEIRSVEVEWPLVHQLDEPSGTRLGRLRQEESRVAAQIDQLATQWSGLLAEGEEIKAQKLEVGPYNAEVAMLKQEIRRLQGVIANESVVRESVELLQEEQSLLQVQAQQAEAKSHVLVAKAEELARLIMEGGPGQDQGQLAKGSMELELNRVVAEAEGAHDAVDSAKAALADQKARLMQEQIELAAATEASAEAQQELGEGHRELVAASREAAAMLDIPRKREAALQQRMDENQEQRLALGEKREKLTERVRAEEERVVEQEAAVRRMQEECVPDQPAS